jgi:hypothetical protein
MADHSTPTPMTMPADGASRPLLSALTRWWSHADTTSADPVLGYESAQPWMLDDTPSVSASHLHY